MAQHKFEEEFRKQLGDREIKPSAESWSKLETQLNAKQRTNKGKPIWWIAIAASIAGVMFLGNYGLSSIEETTAPAPIVEKPMLQEKNPKSLEVNNSEDVQVAIEEKQTREKKEETSSIKNNVEFIKRSSEDKTAVAVTHVETETNNQVHREPEPVSTEEIFSAKLEEVMARVASEETGGGEVTEADVDELLQKAAAEIQMEQQSGTRSASVDAESLLWEVEMELERTFRDKVFEVLKEGYLRTRTAVANRSF